MIEQNNIKNSTADNFPDSVFIGRKDALEQLQAEYNKLVNSTGNFIIITGEKGSGKSALLERFLSSVDSKDTLVANVQFERDLEFTPYKPFIQLVNELEKIQETDPDKYTKSENESTAFQNPNEADSGDFGMQQLQILQNRQSQIQQKVLCTLTEYASQKPLIVSLENAHHAPQSAWQFFHYLADKCQEFPIIFICTLRLDGQTSGVEKEPLYADIVQRMNRDGYVYKLKLERFTDEEIRELLFELFNNTDFSGNFISFLKDISNGIPGQIMKYLRILYERGALFNKNGVWFNNDSINQDNLIRESLDKIYIEIIKSEIGHFSAIQQQILKYACLFKRPFDYRLLVDICEFPKISVVRELKKLQDKKYIISYNESTFYFKSTETKSILASQIEASELERMHQHIAACAETAKFLDSTEKFLLLAYHYGESNNKDKAYPYLVKSGNIALQNFAFAEALGLYKQSLKFERDVQVETDRNTQIHVLMQAAWLNRVLGFYDESISNCREASEIHGEKIHDRLGTLIRIQQGFTYFRLNNWQEAEANFKYCLDRIELMQPYEKSMILYGIGNLDFERGQYSDAQQNYIQALNQAKEISDKSMIALLYNNLGAVTNVTGNTMKAIALYSQAIPLYKEIRDNSGLAKIYNNIGMTYADENNWEQANQFYGKSLSVTGVMGLTPLKSITFLNRALALTQLGKLEEAREYNFKAIRHLEKLNDALGVAEFHKIEGIIEAKKQNWNVSDEHFRKALEIFKKYDNKLGYAETLLESGISELSKNRKEEALKFLSEAHENFKDLNVNKKATVTQEYLDNIQLNGLV